MEKPDYISIPDWQCLKKKCPNQMDEMLHKLNNDYPIQYLIGDVNFLGYQILVNKSVLIPRFETELFVEKVIERLKKINQTNLKIIDIGTGSGCIAISIKKNIDCEMTAIDISKESLEVAKKNAILNQVTIEFISADINNFNLESYDIIISNPPYVSETETVGNSTKFEPNQAIFAENNGLYFYELILKKIEQLKNKPRCIAFEIGYQQTNSIKKLQENYLKNYQFEREQDYSQKDRFLFLTIQEHE